ncbi:MAG TPA: LysR substrate-binding domain-containing protein [Stellaceae bacterium]|nr:LysR substrate-binding domain-containing protein [Stellaceae bacterium]
MRGSEFAELTAFVAIAEHGSFVRAAASLGVSTSTLSQSMRTLEERLGVRLLNRTTRSVAPTEAGEHILARVRPALGEISSAIEEVNAYRDRPTGTLRLSVASLAVRMLIAPVIVRFLAAYPAITVDLTADDGLGVIDIVRGRFDAGIRAGRWIERDMIAVRISPDTRLITLAAPLYLSRRPPPEAPHDLERHDCIRFRWGDTLPRWQFEKAGEKVEIAVSGPLITTDIELTVQAAREGAGICYALESYVAPDLAMGRLVPLLEEWAPRYTGYHIFYPSRRQLPASLTAFIDFLRREGGGSGKQDGVGPPVSA